MSLNLSFHSLPTQEELNTYKVIAEVASNNQHWRKLGGSGTQESIVATILSVMLLARELGISPMQAISGGINNIQGKFEMSARIMNQLIRKHGHLINVRILNDQVCVIWGKRKDTGEEMEVSYHIEEAMRSGLVREGSPWKKVPQDMLFARCISRFGRRFAPDALGGCYGEGEIQEMALAQPVEKVEIPDIKEFQIEEIVTLELPTDVNSERVEKFIQESANHHNKSINEVKKRASGNISGFIDTFKKWEEKYFPHEQLESSLS